MKELETLHFFIHAPAKLSARDLLKLNSRVEENWRRVIIGAGENEKCACCIIQGSGGDRELVDLAREHFGDRCFVDPHDDSPETKLILAEDLQRTFRARGSHGEWNPYELWSSNNARRWAEGLKKEIAERGYGFDPEKLRAESYGNWTGCHHKYSSFLGAYLAFSQPVQKHAEQTLSTLKQFPNSVHEFVECIQLDHYVQLFLFRREDGAPMAQYLDGRRAVWESPHTATVEIDPQEVQLFTISSNALIPIKGASAVYRDGFLADVGDGTRVHTTIVGAVIAKSTHMDFSTFRAALAEAAVSDLEEIRGVYYSVEV
jgi:hypothetical protein